MTSCEHSLNTLRYADRVKELAAAEPAEIKSLSEIDEISVSNQFVNSSVLSDSDLAQLISLNVSNPQFSSRFIDFILVFIT